MPLPSPTRRLALAGLSAIAASAAAGPGLAASAGWPLWIIKAHGGTVYLTGETPGGHADWSDARVETIVPGCAALWTEAGTAARGSISQLMLRYGFDPKTQLTARLSDDDKARLMKAGALAHMPVDRLGTYRPWFVAYQLEQAYRHATGLTGLSANEVLAADAKKAGVPILSEFPAQDDTIAGYGSMSPDADLQFLRYTLDYVLAPAGQTERENADWGRGDVGPATAAVNQVARRYPDLTRALFIERNRRWVPRITAMLGQARPSLVVMGNYHLLGPDGVLMQLRQNGLVARRM